MNQERGQQFLTQLSENPHELPFDADLLATLFGQTSGGSTSSLTEVAETIQRDQGLAARALAIANSAFYGLQSQVTSIDRALVVLGLKEIRTLVLALGVKAITKRNPLPQDFSLPDYWSHQLTVATLARNLAKSTGICEADAVFAAGLLHDLGKLIAAQHAPKDWAAMEELERAQGLCSFQAEDRHWGLDHALVGGLVLKSWSLPADLVEPINWHHSPELCDNAPQAAMLLCVADGAVAEAQNPEAPAAKVWRARAESLGLNPDEVLVLAQEVLDDERCQGMAAALAA